MPLDLLLRRPFSPPAYSALKSRQGRPKIAHRFNGGFSAPENSPSPVSGAKESERHLPGVVVGNRMESRLQPARRSNYHLRSA